MVSKNTVLVTKLAAAERQLNTAIRMTLADEDELAVHTVAAAAYEILRDIKENRGHRELNDAFNRGLFYVARDLASGELTNIPAELSADKSISEYILKLVEGVKSGEISKVSDVDVRLPYSQGRLFWNKFDKPANFLKHAKRDHDKAIAIDELDNHHLLMAACAAFQDVMMYFTLEMQMYCISYFGVNNGFNAISWSDEDALKFNRLSIAERRLFCQGLLKTARESNIKFL